MPRLSICIPVWGNLKRLEDTLLSVLENRPDNCEVVVLLDEPYPDPYDLGDEVRFVAVPRGATHGETLNFALSICDAPIVHLLACGVEVREGWADTALDRFCDPQVAVVAPVVLDGDRVDQLLAAGVGYASSGSTELLGHGCHAEMAGQYRSQVLAPHLAAAFYRKSAWEMAGRFATDVGDDYAYLDLALALEQAGLRTVLEPECRVVAYAGCPAGAFRQAYDAERFFWRAAPRGGWARSVLLHAVRVMIELLVSFPRPAMLSRLAGRLCGMGEIGRRRQRFRPAKPLQPALATAAPGPSTAGLAAPHFRVDSAHRAEQSRAAAGR